MKSPEPLILALRASRKSDQLDLAAELETAWRNYQADPSPHNTLVLWNAGNKADDLAGGGRVVSNAVGK